MNRLTRVVLTLAGILTTLALPGTAFAHVVPDRPDDAATAIAGAPAPAAVQASPHDWTTAIVTGAVLALLVAAVLIVGASRRARRSRPRTPALGT